ncbi:VWA domain-containing protein [Bremerella sp. P1]|uniref:VWA domain-containing protein n=1 Tax=Bremerella sp. P1 TaxID=3026424 RepID=UPI002367E4E9|nr:VWA domain-containing protein [Bremerella sp. P1]WDI44634.1 VWA domain-containing protein [Bremerella sp. P1]
MSTSQQLESIQPADQTQWVQSRRVMPAWLMSLLIHALLGTLLILTVQTVSKGIGDEPARRGSIALANRSENATEYFDGDSSQSADSQQATDSQQAAQAISQAMPALDLPPSALGKLLPQGDQALTGEEATGLPSSGGMTEGGATSKGGLGNEGTTSVFGAEGTGNKFVYVFDRSGSMDGRPLAAAKQQLINSLHDLDKLHQFAIIFYNENPQVFSPRGDGPQLVFADEQGKNLAERFVRGIIASGSTQHVDALSLALRMNPDVVFFLTDADQPQLFPADLDRIRKLNKGCSIHAIEFGYGPYDGRRNFLVKLADENDGKHVYVDISKLRAQP